MIQIESYSNIDGLVFGQATTLDCIAKYGNPNAISKSYYGKLEYSYDNLTVRFDQPNNMLIEATVLPFAKVRINQLVLTWDTKFLYAACRSDGNPLLSYGFVVLNTLGIAITGIHDDDSSQLAVTAYSKGAFDDLLQHSKPFVEYVKYDNV